MRTQHKAFFGMQCFQGGARVTTTHHFNPFYRIYYMWKRFEASSDMDIGGILFSTVPCVAQSLNILDNR